MVLSYSRKSPHFMETKSSLSCLQVSANCPHSQPDQSSPCPHIPLPEANLMSRFQSLRLYQSISQDQRHMYLFCKTVFMVRSCYHLTQPPGWRTTPCRLSVTGYSIYSQPPSILKDVPPFIT
jgi:hypothetical protein